MNPPGASLCIYGYTVFLHLATTGNKNNRTHAGSFLITWHPPMHYPTRSPSHPTSGLQGGYDSPCARNKYFSQGSQRVGGSQNGDRGCQTPGQHFTCLSGTWVCSFTTLLSKGPKASTVLPEAEEWVHPLVARQRPQSTNGEMAGLAFPHCVGRSAHSEQTMPVHSLSPVLGLPTWHAPVSRSLLPSHQRWWEHLPWPSNWARCPPAQGIYNFWSHATEHRG